jgi:hypothetical protein
MWGFGDVEMWGFGDVKIEADPITYFTEKSLGRALFH